MVQTVLQHILVQDQDFGHSEGPQSTVKRSMSMKTEDLYPHGALQQKLLQSKRTLLYTDKPPNLIAHQNVPGPLTGEVTDGECIYRARNYYFPWVV